MFCTGCGSQATDGELICGGCGHARRQASGSTAHPAKAVFHVGQAMQQQAPPASFSGRRWGAFALTLIGLVVCVIIAMS